MKLHPLKVERERRGWSQSKVAEMLGTTTRTVIRWEQGEVVPYPYYRERLCTIYGKNAKQLGLVSDESLQQDSNENQESVQIELELPAEIPTSCSPSELTQRAFLLDPTIPEMLGRAESLRGREHLLIQIKHGLLRADNSPSLALKGLPGIGKTALAAALALDEEVQASFQDGILWGELGPQPDVVGQLARWGTLLGVSASQVENLHSPEAWGKVLQAVIGQRHLLLVIDDAWTAEDAFALRVGGCSYLLTTRLPQVALAFAGEKVISVAELEEADGLSLLVRFVPQLVAQDPEGARVLVRAMGGLPLGLTLMGKYLALQAFTQQPRRLQAALAQVHDAKQRLRVSVPMAPGERTTNLPPGIPPSLYATIAVSDQQLSPQAHVALCALAVFPPKPASFSEEEALVVSQQPAEVLDELWDTGLLESYGAGRYTLHQTVVDYAHALLSEGSVDQVSLNNCAAEEVHTKEKSHAPNDEAFWQQSLRDIYAGYSRSRLVLGSFSHSSGRFVSMIAMTSLCLIIVILGFSLFNSTQLRLLMPAGGTATLVPLSRYVNNKGIGTIPGYANFDGSDFSYPADQLPHAGQITLNGQPYLFPGNAPGVNDNVVALGQTISIPAGHYQQAFLLVAGSWGLVNGTVIVHYADGSTSLGLLSVPDWCLGPPGIVNTSYRYAPADISPGSVHIYAMQIGIDPTKIVSSLTLPTTVLPNLSQPSLHVFALTLQS